jgi:hypothetical protein
LHTGNCAQESGLARTLAHQHKQRRTKRSRTRDTTPHNAHRQQYAGRGDGLRRTGYLPPRSPLTAIATVDSATGDAHWMGRPPLETQAQPVRNPRICNGAQVHGRARTRTTTRIRTPRPDRGGGARISLEGPLLIHKYNKRYKNTMLWRELIVAFVKPGSLFSLRLLYLWIRW